MHRKVLVTGKHEGWVPPLDVEFNFLEVLDFSRLPIAESFWNEMEKSPFQWIVFTSPRAVRFWTESLLEAGMDFPIETKVACIGEKTKIAAEMDGYSPDFYPSEAGSEAFFSEFKHLLQPLKEKLRVLLPASQIARPYLRESLQNLGCEVVTLPLYETVAKKNLKENVSQSLLENADLLLFTSPSSVEAVLSQISLPKKLKVAAIGNFTRESLREHGYENTLVLREGDESRVGELL